MTTIKEWNEERNAVLRSLDSDHFMAFWRKHDLPMPPAGKWAHPVDVPMIMMHKARLQVTSMSKEEQEISRSWLVSHDYDPDII